jgi:putative aldouronate transport system permease protein
MNSRRKRSAGTVVLHICMACFALVCVLPVVLVASVSLTDEASLTSDGCHLIPSRLSLAAYRYILDGAGSLLHSYLVTISVTVLGTFLSLFVTSALAYAISRRDYRYRKATAFYVFFTMVFNGGLVPWYILVTRYLHLKDTILSLILPYLVVPWFVLLMKGFLAGIPTAVIESAKIDGAGEFRIYRQIALPLAKSGLVTVGFFMALQFWNDWWLSLLFVEKQGLVPLQLMLYRIMSSIEFLSRNIANLGYGAVSIPTNSARMAMCILAAGPMLVVFLLFQRHFARGVALGAVKG